MTSPPRNLCAITALLVSLTSLPAGWASSVIAIAPPPDEPLPKRIELDVGLLAGGLDIGTDRADATGVNVNAGLRVGDLSILGELGHINLREDERGTLMRAGILGRYSLVPLGPPDGFATTDIWVEGGFGWEKIDWNSGGTMARPDLALGFGWQANFVLGRGTANPRYFGPFVGMRTLISRGRAPNGDATCGGPCDMATLPSRTDVSYFFSLGFNWGRKSL